MRQRWYLKAELRSADSRGRLSPQERSRSKIGVYADSERSILVWIGDIMAEPDNTQPRPNPIPNPNEKLVKVFGSEQESEALVVKGLLESAGIDSDLTSASLVQDAFPGLGGVILMVREEDADAASALIAEQRQAFSGKSPSAESSPDDDSTAEIAIMEEPPPKG